jgi:hypothetical protein
MDCIGKGKIELDWFSDLTRIFGRTCGAAPKTSRIRGGSTMIVVAGSLAFPEPDAAKSALIVIVPVPLCYRCAQTEGELIGSTFVARAVVP